MHTTHHPYFFPFLVYSFSKICGKGNSGHPLYIGVETEIFSDRDHKTLTNENKTIGMIWSDVSARQIVCPPESNEKFLFFHCKTSQSIYVVIIGLFKQQIDGILIKNAC